MSIVYYGGLDVHQKSIAAFLYCSETGECIEEEVPNDRVRLLRAVSRWGARGELRLCYEASSAGFVIKRWLDEVGVDCEVVAPAFIPKGSGDRNQDGSSGRAEVGAVVPVGDVAYGAGARQ